MVLYHFTAKRFLKSINKSGLTKGRMVKSIEPITFINNKQWLTKNNSFNQHWAHGTGTLPYHRNEVRLTIEIPEVRLSDLKPWGQMMFLTPEVAQLLSSEGDPENWYIFNGKIFPAWIKSIDFKN